MSDALTTIELSRLTAPLFAESMAVIESWGFKYKTNLVWDKERPYYGHYSHVRHEHLCICTRGSCTPEPDAQLPQSIIAISRTRHSRKPHEFYELVDSLYPDGKRIELFARNRRDVWDSWGHEVDDGARGTNLAVTAGGRRSDSKTHVKTMALISLPTRLPPASIEQTNCVRTQERRPGCRRQKNSCKVRSPHDRSRGSNFL
ncbi:MAG: MT-A70 family methyltransferase [Planctomycetaceae bacterium]